MIITSNIAQQSHVLSTFRTHALLNRRVLGMPSLGWQRVNEHILRSTPPRLRDRPRQWEGPSHCSSCPLSPTTSSSLWLLPRPLSRLLKAEPSSMACCTAYWRETKFWNIAFPDTLPSAHKMKLLRARDSSRLVAGWTLNIPSCLVLKSGLPALLPPPVGSQNARAPPLEAARGKGQRRGPRCLDLMALNPEHWTTSIPTPSSLGPWIFVRLSWACPHVMGR